MEHETLFCDNLNCHDTFEILIDITPVLMYLMKHPLNSGVCPSDTRLLHKLTLQIMQVSCSFTAFCSSQTPGYIYATGNMS